jgi:hypothetical protein
MTQKIAIRGLARLAARLFFVWGALLILKGLWDCGLGQPEANSFSPGNWEFVTQQQWYRFAGFELAYGLACMGLARAAWVFSFRLPEWINERE